MACLYRTMVRLHTDRLTYHSLMMLKNKQCFEIPNCKSANARRKERYTFAILFIFNFPFDAITDLIDKTLNRLAESALVRCRYVIDRLQLTVVVNGTIRRTPLF